MSDSSNRTRWRRRFAAFLVGVALPAGAISACSCKRPPAFDANPALQNLGIPYAEQYSAPNEKLARNVWDMAAYQGRLYLGAGDLNVNTPPPKLVYWDPSTAEFVIDLVTDDHAITRFRPCYGTLCIPGADATQSDPSKGNAGNVYLHQSGTWLNRVIDKNVLHVDDVVSFDGALFAGLLEACDPPPGDCGRTSVTISKDLGETWEESQPLTSFGGTLATFFTDEDRLYANVAIAGSDAPASRWFEFDGTQFNPSSIDLIPDGDALALMGGPPTMQPGAIETGGTLVYLAAYVSGLDPYSLWKAASLASPERISLPGDPRPRDLLLIEHGPLDTRVAVLTSTKLSSGDYRTSVFVSKDLKQWTELFTFTQPTFVRCFEHLNGDFYMALGGYGTTDTPTAPYYDGGDLVPDGVSPLAGTILRLPGSSIPASAW
jgi:hypothetical protein